MSHKVLIFNPAWSWQCLQPHAVIEGKRIVVVMCEAILTKLTWQCHAHQSQHQSALLTTHRSYSSRVYTAAASRHRPVGFEQSRSYLTVEPKRSPSNCPNPGVLPDGTSIGELGAPDVPKKLVGRSGLLCASSPASLGP